MMYSCIGIGDWIGSYLTVQKVYLCIGIGSYLTVNQQNEQQQWYTQVPFIEIDYIGFVKLFPIPIPIPNLLPHHTTGKFRVQTGHHTVQ